MEEEGSFPPPSPLPSKTLERRRPRHPGLLQPGSVPRVHRVRPVHVPRVEIALGVREAPLSHSLVPARGARVVQRRERGRLLLPPQMFGRLRTRRAAAAGHRFPADWLHPPRHVGLKMSG